MEITLEEAKKTKQCYRVFYAFYDLGKFVNKTTYFRYKTDAKAFLSNLEFDLTYSIIQKF